MAQSTPPPTTLEHSDQETLDLTVSAETMERRRAFARAAREIAACSPMPWRLDVVELLREDRER